MGEVSRGRQNSVSPSLTFVSQKVISATNVEHLAFGSRAHGETVLADLADFVGGETGSLGKGDYFNSRLGGEVLGGVVEDFDEGFVGVAGAEIFPPVRNQDGELAFGDGGFDARENF